MSDNFSTWVISAVRSEKNVKYLQNHSASDIKLDTLKILLHNLQQKDYVRWSKKNRCKST